MCKVSNFIPYMDKIPSFFSISYQMKKRLLHKICTAISFFYYSQRGAYHFLNRLGNVRDASSNEYHFSV